MTSTLFEINGSTGLANSGLKKPTEGELQNRTNTPVPPQSYPWLVQRRVLNVF